MNDTQQLTPAERQIVLTWRALDQWYAGLSANERLHLQSLPRPAQLAYVKQHSPALAAFHQ